MSCSPIPQTPVLNRWLRNCRGPIPLALLLGVCASSLAAETVGEGDGPWVFRAYGATEQTLLDLGSRFDHVAWFPDKGMALFHAEDRSDRQALLAAGLRLELDPERTATLETIARYRAAGAESITTIPGFECYRTVEETLATGAALAAQAPQLASWIDVGDSWEKIHLPPAGFDLQVLRLTNSAIPGDKPALLVTGSIHAREYTTAELVTRFAEKLVAGHGVDPDITWILDHHEVHLLLMANPDGRKRAETGLSWRKNANNDFCSGTNTRGIDLNRNFDFEWGCCNGSSTSPCSLTFRGPSPASEPEAQAVQDYMESIFPDQRPDDLTTPAPLDAEGIYLDIHSFGQIVLSPWSFQAGGGNPPNAQGLLTLGRKYGFFPDYAARLGSTGIVDGSTKDYSYGHLGVPGYTIELGTTFFETCPFFETAILDDNLAALLHIAKNVRTPYVTPSGPDAIAPRIPPLPVAAGQPVLVTATVDDTRYDGPEPTQTILGAEIYVDTPPWQGGTAAAMVASDGAFDAAVEGVEATVDTTGLAAGRHTLFVRGQDAHSTFGAVSAEFLHVIDPAVAPTFAGTVTDAVSGEPLAATVEAGPFRWASDPADGSFAQQLPSGTYDVRAVAPGYAPEPLLGLELADSETVSRSFELLPLSGIFSDDAEAGNVGWVAEPPWTLTDETSNSPTHSWADSPGGNYGPNTNTSLTSPPFHLGEFEGTTLSFNHLFDFERGFDFGLLEVSTDGQTWTTVRRFSRESQNAEWVLVQIPLPSLDGAPSARFRFRVTSDGNGQRDGWHLDDIVLEAARVSLFADGFESGDLSGWAGPARSP